MSLIDLTCAVPSVSREKVRLTEIPLKSAKTAYTGMVYDLEFNSMDGSYLDLPGHIRETDDGQRSDNLDPAQFYRVPCSVIRLDRTSGSGAVSGADGDNVPETAQEDDSSADENGGDEADEGDGDDV